jgi:hypothetical protein
MEASVHPFQNRGMTVENEAEELVQLMDFEENEG